MPRDEMTREAYARLRCLAEERIKKWSYYVIDEHTDLHQVIYELQIHPVE